MALQKALVVDDSKLARISLRKQLQARGLDVEMVESGQDALNLLKETTVDVVFMDHLMPNMDGFEAMHAIKANPVTKGIPVIMCTGKEDPGYLEEAVANGAAGILAKPPGDEALDEALVIAEAAKDAPIQTAAAPTPAAPVAASVIEEAAPIIPNFDPELIQQLQSQVANLSSTVSSLAQQMAEMANQISSPSSTTADIDTTAIMAMVDSQITDKIQSAVASIEPPTPTEPAQIDVDAIVQQIENKISSQLESKITDAVSNIKLPEPPAAEPAVVDTSSIMSELQTQLSNQINDAVSKIEVPSAAPAEVDTDSIASQIEANLNDKLIASVDDKIKQAVNAIELPTPASADIDTSAIVSQAEQSMNNKFAEMVDNKIANVEATISEQIQSQIAEKLSQQENASADSGISENRVKEIALDIASEVVSQQPPAEMSGDSNAEVSQQQIDAILTNAIEAARSAAEQSAIEATESMLAGVDEKIAAASVSSNSDGASASNADTSQFKQQLESALESANAAKIPGIIAIVLAIGAIALKFINLG